MTRLIVHPKRSLQVRTHLSAAKTSMLKQLKQWAAGRFLSRVHRITHRLPAELRTVKPCRVMVLAPHMDDEVIGPGGTLALHQAAGSNVGVVFTTNSNGGAPPDLKGSAMTERRTAEARDVAQRLGFDILDVFGFPDGQLSRHEPDLATNLARSIRDWAPDQIFCPFPADHHRDHQATSAGLADALRKTGWQGEVWCYEIWSTLWPNVEIDITSVVETKREAIALYYSQVASMSYIESTLGLNRYRGLRVRVPYAEAFFVCDTREYLRLAGILSEI